MSDGFTSDTARQAVDVAEKYADGDADDVALRAAFVAVSQLRSLSALVAECAVAAGAGGRAGRVVDVAGQFAATDAEGGYEPKRWAQEWKAHSDLIRDIFGNPFRPATFDTAWRTSTVTALASQMYESRDFGAMPILADALQDAGCTDEEVLNHCRGDGPHVRGCWVADLVLGKG